jgi:hypothetical protein
MRKEPMGWQTWLRCNPGEKGEEGEGKDMSRDATLLYRNGMLSAQDAAPTCPLRRVSASWREIMP